MPSHFFCPSWLGRKLAIAICCYAALATTVVLAQDLTNEPATSASAYDQVVVRLPEVTEEVQALKLQISQLRTEMEQMQAALGPVSITAPVPGPTKTPEEEQAAFNKLSDAARLGRYPNVAINGVFQADAGFFRQDTVNRQTVGNAVDGADFRRARLSAKGSVTENFNYFFQMDFAFFGRPTFTDVWVEQAGLPVLGNVRVGQWKQPFSLEVVSSFRYTTFMERSLLFQTFTPFRHTGIGFYNNAEDLRSTWAASGFRTGQDQFADSATNGGGWGTAERITYLPWWHDDSDGRQYLHLGFGHYFSAPPDRRMNFRTIPELFIGQSNQVANGNQQPIPGNVTGTPFFIQTGNLAVNTFNVLNLEALMVNGPFSWQTEGMLNIVDLQGGPTVTMPGFYSQVGWFLTGEHRPYDRKAGAIDRIIPIENFFRVRTGEGIGSGRGAWEVAFRVSYLDFSQVNGRVTPAAGTPATGGHLTDLTAGVNWYLNPYSKVVFNGVHSFLDNPATGQSQSDGFAGRVQVDF